MAEEDPFEEERNRTVGSTAVAGGPSIPERTAAGGDATEALPSNYGVPFSEPPIRRYIGRNGQRIWPYTKPVSTMLKM